MLAAAGAVLTGCTTLQTAALRRPPRRGRGPAASAPTAAPRPRRRRVGPAPAGRASGRRCAPGGLRPFADVIKDARRIDGLAHPLAEGRQGLARAQARATSTAVLPLAEAQDRHRRARLLRRPDAGQRQVVEFRRIHNQVQLIWRNVGYIARPGTPEARAIEAGYSPSLLASAPVLSLPEPERKSVLVEANTLFLADLLGFGMDLQRAYRQGYALRSAQLGDHPGARRPPMRSSSKCSATTRPASISVPQPGTPPGVPQPSAPKSLPDPRSMFLTIALFARAAAGRADARRAAPIRASATSRAAASTSATTCSARRASASSTAGASRRRIPAAALSEPVKPIVFWIDRTVPFKYRAVITAGVLEWNKAFEKIGFKNAVRVEVQPDDADFDTLDFGRSSIRWMTNAVAVASARSARATSTRAAARSSTPTSASRACRRATSAPRARRSCRRPASTTRSATPIRRRRSSRCLMSGRVCTYGEMAAEQMTYGADVLEARGDLEPGSPEAEAFVEAYLKDVTMHEVGHTLGLRHNFRASRVYTQQQLADPAFTRANGITGSVMEYAPINLNSADEPRERYGTPFNDTLGPYDYWAIEYAYKPLASGLSAADERAALEKIAGRSAEPLLAYGTDEDNFIGVDPETLQFDLGGDVIAFAKKRIAIAQELLKRQETRTLRPDQDYNVLKRSVSYALRDVARAANVLSRQIGGVRTLRDAPGHRPRPADAGAASPSSARRSTSSPAACSRPTASASRRRCRGSSAPTSPSAPMRSSAARARRQTDYSPSGAGARPAALAARGDDERHGRDAAARKQREGAFRQRPRPAHARAVRAADAGGVERARRPRRRHRAAAPRGAARPRQPHRRAADPSRRREPRRHAQHRPGAGAGAARADPRRRPAARA